MHRRFNTAIGVLALTCALSAVAFPVAMAIPHNQCWELTQESCTIGKLQLWICDTAVRWYSPRLGLTFLLKAPDWKLVGFNDNTKKYMQMRPDQLEAMMRRGKTPVKEKNLDVALAKKAMIPLKDNTTKICGLKTIELHMPKGLASRGGGGSAAPSTILNAKIKAYDPKKWLQGDEDTWFAADIQLPTSVSAFLGQKAATLAANAPGAKHPLLRSVHIGDNGSPAMALDTSDCKQVPITAKLFEVPKGYDKTDNEMALLMGVDDNDMDILGSSTKKRQY